MIPQRASEYRHIRGRIEVPLNKVRDRSIRGCRKLVASAGAHSEVEEGAAHQAVAGTAEGWEASMAKVVFRRSGRRGRRMEVSCIERSQY